jgi:N-terminal acetyltransferase B complex catalytic subunit
MATWPDYNYVLKSPDGSMMGYIMGKAEGPKHLSQETAKARMKWHGHVTAVTVSPEFRRLGMATLLMEILETTTEQNYGGYFVDLFVRASNVNAITMYEKLGYKTYRRVKDYYQDEGARKEDGLDMRKSMIKLDPDRKTEQPLGRDVTIDELDETL